MGQDGCKILLVDDDRDILTVIKMRLELMGFEVTSCEDPVEALKLFDGHELVITDQRMDRLRGIELLERLKERDPSLPVIIMTAFGTVDDAVDAVKSGAFSYIEKPVNPTRLAELINSALEQRRIQEQLRLERELLGNAISSIGACLFVLSYDRMVLWANTNAAELLDLNAMTLPAPLPPQDPAVEEMIDGATRRSESRAVELFLDETGRWLLFSATPNPKLGNLAVLAVDITDFKKAQRSLAEKERLAGALEMAGAVAHQFSQPMQAIILQCDLLSQSLLDEDKRRKAAQALMSQVDKLGQLIREITSLTQYATMDYPGHIRIFDLARATKAQAVQKGLPGMDGRD